MRARGPSFEARKSALLRMRVGLLCRSMLTSLWPVQRIDRHNAHCARHARADLAVFLLLLLAEEDVAMIDLALDGDNVDGTDAAFAALAVRHHLEAGVVEH